MTFSFFYSFLSLFFLWNFLLAVSIEGHILFFSNDHREIHVEYSYFHQWTDCEMLINASKCSTSTREPDEKLAEVEHYHHAQTSLNYSGTSTNGHLSTTNNSHLPITASFYISKVRFYYTCIFVLSKAVTSVQSHFLLSHGWLL